jgi:hypothetical protein
MTVIPFSGGGSPQQPLRQPLERPALFAALSARRRRTQAAVSLATHEPAARPSAAGHGSVPANSARAQRGGPRRTLRARGANRHCPQQPPRQPLERPALFAALSARRRRTQAARLLAASSLAALAGAGLLASDTNPPALLAAWPASTPVIDGRTADWTTLAPLEAVHVSIGLSNDDRQLSLVLTSSDQARRRQLIGGGLIVWFDPAGGKKRAFGVRFPGEFPGGDRPEIGRGRAGTGGPPDQNASTRTPPADGDSPQARPAERLPPITWFELIGPKDDDRRRLETKAVTDIAIARALEEGLLVFELRVPLAKDPVTGFGIGAAPGQVLGLGLETPELERPETAAPDRGRGGRGGMGGVGGGFGGMGRGGMGGGGMGGRPDGPPGDRPERAKPVRLWTTVKLASGTS